MKRSQIRNLRFLLFLLLALTTINQVIRAQQQQDDRININTASAEELMRLPGIGPALANRIVRHRQKHGAFKRPQDIIVVRGMSAKRYRLIANLIRT